MYLHLGEQTVVRASTVVGIFDTDNTTLSKVTRDYLSRAEQEGRVITITLDLPKSFVVCKDDNGDERIYLCQLSAATLKKRLLARESNRREIPT